MYRPPLVSFIAATTASVEMPAKSPDETGCSPRKCPSTIPVRIAAPTLVTNSAPPFFSRQGAGEEGAGERAEELRHVGEKSRDQRTCEQGHDHHAAGNAFDRAFDWDLGHAMRVS